MENPVDDTRSAGSRLHAVLPYSGSVLGATGGHSGQHQCTQNDGAVHRTDPFATRAGKRQNVLDEAERDNATKGAKKSAFAAIQCDPAKYGRRKIKRLIMIVNRL
jgi:hypothetical protein